MKRASPSNRRPRRVLYEPSCLLGSDWSQEDELSRLAAGKVEAETPSVISIAIALSPLVQRINVIFIFLQVFQRLEQGRLRPATLILTCLLLLVFAKMTSLLFLHGREPHSTSARSHLGKEASQPTPPMTASFAILLLLLYALSPVLKTLTEATSSDSIYPLSFLLFGLHICLDSNTLPTKKMGTGSQVRPSRGGRQGKLARSTSRPGVVQQPQLFSALSLNAATSASLVLASRLPSNAHVFALLFISILCFALFPAYVRSMQSVKLKVMASILSVTLALSLAWSVSRTMCVVAVGMNTFVLAVVPAWMRAASREQSQV